MRRRGFAGSETGRFGTRRTENCKWLRGKDLNLRPLGYEGKFDNNTELRRPVNPNKTLTILPAMLARLGSLWPLFADSTRTGTC
jgi:hypothetical protein